MSHPTVLCAGQICRLEQNLPIKVDAGMNSCKIATLVQQYVTFFSIVRVREKHSFEQFLDTYLLHFLVLLQGWKNIQLWQMSPFKHNPCSRVALASQQHNISPISPLSSFVQNKIHYKPPVKKNTKNLPRSFIMARNTSDACICQNKFSDSTISAPSLLWGHLSKISLWPEQIHHLSSFHLFSHSFPTIASSFTLYPWKSLREVVKKNTDILRSGWP